MRTRRQDVWTMLVLAGCVLMLAGTGLPQLDSVTAHYGEIAKHALATGEWITLERPDRPGWIQDKPPLTLWLMAASLWAFGDTDFALRFWHVLMGLALVYATYRLARLAGGLEASTLAALLVLTFQQVFYLTGTPQQDIPLTLFLTLAFYAYVVYRRDGHLRDAVLCAIWVALGALTKGLVMLAVFGPVLAADLAIAFRRHEIAYWHWRHAALASVVFLIIGLPWFVIGAVRQGAPFVDTFISGDAGTARFFRQFLPGAAPAGSRLAAAAVPLAYVPMLVVGMLPWAGLLPGAIGVARRSFREGPHVLRVATLWVVWLFLLLSLSAGDKVFRYLLPIFPPLAVLAARHLTAVIDDARALRGAAWLSLLVGVPMFAATVWISGAETPDVTRLYVRLALPSLVVFAAALVVFAGLIFRGQGRRAVAWLAAGALVSYALTWLAVGRNWERLWPWKTIGMTVNRLYRPGDRILVVGSAGAETDFATYQIAPVVSAVKTDEEFLAAWSDGAVIGLISPEAYARLEFRLAANVLVRTPMGWILATNRR